MLFTWIYLPPFQALVAGAQCLPHHCRTSCTSSSARASVLGNKTGLGQTSHSLPSKTCGKPRGISITGPRLIRFSLEKFVIAYLCHFHRCHRSAAPMPYPLPENLQYTRNMTDCEHEARLQEVASPSSSSRASTTERYQEDTWTAEFLAHKGDDWSSDQVVTLVPSLPGRRTDRNDSKHGVISHCSKPCDMRCTSTNHPPCSHAPLGPLSRPSTHVSGQLSTKTRLSTNLFSFWCRNRSYLLVIISTLFGSAMTLFTKLLESGDDGMHPFQILFIRMAISLVVCLYMLYLRQPSEFPLGPEGVRWLLFLRGITGFFGIFGIWTSIRKSLRRRHVDRHVELG